MEKLLFMIDCSFSHNVFKSLLLQRHQNVSIYEGNSLKKIVLQTISTLVALYQIKKRESILITDFTNNFSINRTNKKILLNCNEFGDFK